jgi:four helix bundle protein
MPEIQNFKQYDLEERTYLFAKRCRDFVKKLPKSASNFEYGKQLVRSSASQAANYIEANEALRKKRFYSQNKNLPKRNKRELFVAKIM